MHHETVVAGLAYLVVLRAGRTGAAARGHAVDTAAHARRRRACPRPCVRRGGIAPGRAHGARARRWQARPAHHDGRTGRPVRAGVHRDFRRDLAGHPRLGPWCGHAARQHRHAAGDRRNPGRSPGRHQPLRTRERASLRRLLRLPRPRAGRGLRAWRPGEAGHGQIGARPLRAGQPGHRRPLAAAGAGTAPLRHHQPPLQLPQPLLRQQPRQDIGRMDPRPLAVAGRRPQRCHHRAVHRLQHLQHATVGDPHHPRLGPAR